MRPTTILKNSTLRWTMVLSDAAGDAIDADSLPTATVRTNGAAVTPNPTAVNIGTGIYEFSWDPAGEIEGQVFTIRETVIIDTKTKSNPFEVSVVVPERGTENANTVTPNIIAPVTAGQLATAITGQNTLITGRTLPALEYFKPAEHTVARVALVDTTTVNTDMVGTANANKIAPNTVTPVTAGQLATAISNQSNSLNSLITGRTLVAADYFDPDNHTIARVALVDTTTVNTDMVGTANANKIAPNTVTPVTAGQLATAITNQSNAINNKIDTRTLPALEYFNAAQDTIANVNTVGTLTGHTPQTGDSYSRIGAGGAGLSSCITAAGFLIASDLSPLAKSTEIATLTSVVNTMPAAMEAALIDEGDGQTFVDAMVLAIGNVNIVEASMAAALRSDMERPGGMIASLSTVVDTIPKVLVDISSLSTHSAADAANTTKAAMMTGPGKIESDATNQIKIDSSGISSGGGSGVTPLQLTDALATQSTSLSSKIDERTLPALEYFKPAEDVIARVALVDTTTTNTDMVGTKNANKIAPNTIAPVTIAQLNGAISGQNVTINDHITGRTLAAPAYFNAADDIIARVTLVDTTTVNSDMIGTANANKITPNTIAPATPASVAAVASDLAALSTIVNAIPKALVDISSLSTHNAADVADATKSAMMTGPGLIEADANNQIKVDSSAASGITPTELTDAISTQTTTLGSKIDSMTASIPGLQPLDRESIPASRSYLLAHTSDRGLVGEATKSVTLGRQLVFGVDFARDLKVGQQIAAVTTAEIQAGTTGGVTIDETGYFGSRVKLKLTGVTAGEYTLRVAVSYIGGGTQEGDVVLRVIA